MDADRPETAECCRDAGFGTGHQLSPYSTDNFQSLIKITKQKAPLVSVIMSSHNRQDYIEEAIESIRKQTLQNFEFIIVNDASNDNTQNILNYYETIDSRIHVLTNTSQMGISYSRNQAYKLSRGKYIAVMDDDDISLSDRFEKKFLTWKNTPKQPLLVLKWTFL